MLWSSALLLVFAGLAAADNGWKAGYQYEYNIEARTVAGLHQVADQYSGNFIHGKLNVYVESDNRLTLQVQEAKYADFNQHFSEGWATDLHHSQFNFKTFPIKNDVFQIYLRNGVVEKLVVDDDTSYWELNFIKAITSQFQVDVQGQNLKRSKINDVPKGQQETGVYKTMEDSINGNYETLYEVSLLPDYVLQTRPELAPLPQLRNEGEFYSVIKTRNFSSSDRHLVYRYGFNGHEGWNAGTNQMGNFLSRTSQSRIILSGKLNKYTIQSSVTTEKVLVAPHLYNSQKGIVASRVNLTLEDFNNFKGSVPSINSPKTIDNLSYEYEQGYPQNGDSNEGADSSSSSNDSSQSSSSSSEENNWNQKHKRQTRSVTPPPPQTSSSSSESSSSSSSSEENRNNPIRQGASSSSSSSSSESSSISSSEEYLSPQPQINDAPQIEFLPYHVVNQRSESGQTVEQIMRVARQIGKFLQNPSNIPKDNVLTYYSMLSHLTAAANTQQLEEATEKLYYPEEKIQGSTNQESYHYYRSWQAYRDAVAQAGTGPALVTIYSWIKSGKIRGNEAAQVVAVLPKSARYPTTEYMDYFFGLVKSSQVQNQKYLNDSAVLSFTDLVRRSQVDRESAHHRYPIHLTGAQAQNHLAVVVEKYIPYFETQLKKAVEQGDSIKIQVNTKALTNTGHPIIWSVLAPYLTGKRPISDFQRVLMIANMRDMARVHPNTARAVLYKIYQNQGDVHQVRSAAAFLLMKTNPPPQLIQHMAEQTNYDQSEHVSAAVKSLIESLANAKYFINEPLYKSARSAANLLTPKEYGFQHPQYFIQPYVAEEHNTLEYQHDFASFQGLDGLYPNSIIYNLERKTGGYLHEPQTVSFMSSSSEEFLNFFFGQLGLGGHRKETHHKHGMAQQKQGQQQYSYQKINEILNGQYDEPVQVEGNLFFSFFGSPRFFAFDNHTIERFPQYIKQIHQKLQKGFNFHETKYYNQHSVEVGFPLATGVPFIYSYNEPTLFFADVEAKKGNFQREQEKDEYYKIPYKASTEGTYKFTWSSQKRGKLGFVAPYSVQEHCVIAENGDQVYFPMEAKSQFNGPQHYFQATIRPYSGESNEQQKVFQHSTQIYTTYNKLYDTKPYLQGSNARPVQVASSQSFKRSFGHAYTGYAFQVEAESENNFTDYLRIFKALKTLDYDFISSAFYHDLVHTLANNYYAVSYDPRNSSPEKVVIKFYYDKEEQVAQHKKSAKLMNVRGKRTSAALGSNLAQPSSVDNRVEEIFANAYSGIQDAKAQIFDASVSIEGNQNKGQYVFTLAHAESPVSENSRYLAYFSGTPYQESQDAKAFKAALQVNFKKPQVPIFNYKKAFESDPTSYVEGQINFNDNEDSKIAFQGKMEQTEERKNYIKHSQYSAVCQQQMQQNNYIQPACRNASLQANTLDNYEFTFKYQNIPQEFQKFAYASYAFARHAGYQFNNEAYVGVKNEQGQIKLGFRFSEDLSYFNFSLAAPFFNSEFENIELNHQLRPFLVQYPAYNQLYFYSPYYFYTKHYATCSLDDNLVSTFNNRSYPFDFGDVYYVLASTVPQENQENSEQSSETYSFYRRNFAVIAKENGSQKKEVQILLDEDTVSLQPSGADGVTVVANGEIIQISDSKLARWENDENQFVAYSSPGHNNVVLYFNNHGFQVYYDGNRVALFASNHHRNQIRGICGTFDGEPANDFTTPSNCVLKDYQQFAASYAVPEAYQGPVKQHKQAQNAACYPRRVIYGDVSYAKAGREHRKPTMSGNDVQGQRPRMPPCSTYKVHIIKDAGKACFSLRPQVACNPSCKPAKTIEKPVDFHCIPDEDRQSEHWLRMVKKGANPDFSQKAANSKMRVMLPESCISS